MIGVSVVFVLLCAGVANERIRRSRTVWVVNGFERPVTVGFRGGPAFELKPGCAEAVRIPEGEHEVAFSGVYSGVQRFEVRQGYFSRWLGLRTWVVNPAGAAYFFASEPMGVGGDSGLYFGESFYEFTGVAGTFSHEEWRRSPFYLPEPRYLEVGTNREGVFRYLNSNVSPAEAVRFAKSTLPARPNDGALLDLAAGAMPVDEFETLLKSGLAGRPVAVAWHRHYQNLQRGEEAAARLRAEYDAALSKEPENAALLYLRGRVSVERAETVGFFERALSFEPGFAWAAFAMGYDAMARGQFDTAAGFLERANEANPLEQSFRAAWRSLRLGLGRAAEVEDELRRTLKVLGADWRATRELAVIFAGQGRVVDAMAVVGETRRRVSRGESAEADLAARAIEREAFYFAGDFAALEARVVEDGARSTALGVLSMLGRGAIADAIAQPYFPSFLEGDGSRYLVVALAARNAGEHAIAGEYERLALPLLKAASPDHRRAAALIERGGGSVSQLDDVVIPFQEKAVLCALLAAGNPGERSAFLGLAAKLNLLNDPIVKRAVLPQ
jgi:tetratricopeptide (TPR) repeat protein